MPAKTFAAFVTDGQLHFQQSLAELEGQQVLVTLTPPAEPRSEQRTGDPGPPEWLDVERDIVVRGPFRWERVQARAVDGGAIRPSVILPVDLPDV